MRLQYRFIPVCLALGTLFLLSSNAVAQIPGGSLVISALYGGGGNTSATLRNDFVQIYNRTDSTISLSGLSLQYGGGSSTVDFSGIFAFGNVSIPKNRYFLVQFASGGIVGSTFLSDAIGAFNMGTTAGKIALVNGITAVNSQTTTGTSIVDFVGYGSANASEGTSASAPSVSTALLRITNISNTNLQDTNANSSDTGLLSAPGGFAANYQPLYSGSSAGNLPISDAVFQPIPELSSGVLLGIAGLVGLLGIVLHTRPVRTAKRKPAAP